MSLSQNLPRRFGDYRLLHLVGRGGNGAAYLASPAEATGLPSPLIVKTMSPAAAERESDRKRFRHEAELAVAARVPSVAAVYDAGLVGDTPYIAMEFVRGMSLGSLLKKLSTAGAMLPAGQVLDLALSGLGGLEALHGAVGEDGRPLQVVHRDVTPRNLMIDPAGAVRVLDLGLGRSLLSELHTRTGSILGTPGYMSPEQVLGSKTSQASDVYSFGIIVWELLAMQRYILRGPLPEVLKRTVQRVYEPPSRHRPGLPPELDRVLASALALDARQRLPDATSFREALRAVRDRADLGAADAGHPVVPLAEIYSPELTEARVAELLALPDDEPAPDRVQTVVYARRAPETITEASARSELSTTEPPIALATATATAPLDPAEPRRPSPITRGSSKRWLGGLLAAAMLIALGLGVVLMIRSWPQRPAVVAPATPPPPARVEPQIRARIDPAPPQEETSPPAEPETDARPAAKASARKDRGARPDAPTTPAAIEPAPAEPAEPSAREQLDRLLARGESLKRERPERAAEIDEVLGAAVFESVAGDTPEARRRIRALAARLERITRAAP